MLKFTHCPIFIILKKIFLIGLPMRLGFNITRGYHIQVKKADLFAVKGKKFKLKDLPSSFLHPQLNKSHLVFSTEEIVKM